MTPKDKIIDLHEEIEDFVNKLDKILDIQIQNNIEKNDELNKYQKVIDYEEAKNVLFSKQGNLVDTTIALMIGSELGFHISLHGLNLNVNSLKDLLLRSCAVVPTYVLLRLFYIRKQQLKVIKNNFELKEYIDYLYKKRIISKNEKEIKNIQIDKENLLLLKRELESYLFDVKSINEKELSSDIKKVNKTKKSLYKKYNQVFH